MSSFWASVKKRKNSGTASISSIENTKPPSGRSSVSKGSKIDRNTKIDRRIRSDVSQVEDEEENDSEKGCLKLPRFAGQVLQKRNVGHIDVRLPQVFYKGLRTASLPRHFLKRSDVPPTPAPTPEPDLLKTPEENPLKPPVPESPKPKLKGFRKRAASASPSRAGEGEKRKSFRGISRERFLPAMPAVMKNFIRSRQSRNSAKDKIPLKPSRRPGPVGKTWVKVFDDIVYMDDPNYEDEYPIPGYTGHPTFIPDAEPLPAAPTPPPKKIQDLIRSNLSESDYDNVQKPSMPEPEDERTNIEEVIKDKKLESNKENIPERSFLANIKEKEVASRPSRSRDHVRYKGRKQKRPATPVGREPIEPDRTDDSQRKQEPARNESKEEINDKCITPEDPMPPKPPRGNKVYEELIRKVEAEERMEIQMDDSEEKISPSENEDSMKDGIHPDRPQRGLKIYDNLLANQQYPAALVIEGEEDEKIVSDAAEEALKKAEAQIMEDEIPNKPKRGNKIYETIESLAPVEDETEEKKGEMNSDALEQKTTEIVSENIEEEIPPRPTRGIKIYATIKTLIPPQGEIASAADDELKEATKPDIIFEIKAKEEIEDGNSDFKDAYPTYAKVKKDGKIKETIEEDEDDIPPPIPPKKKGIKTISPPPPEEVVYDEVPSRPPRKLKLRPRSLGGSPCCPKRMKTVAILNEECIIFPKQNQTKIYAGIDYDKTFDDPSKPMRHLKSGKSNFAANKHENRPLPPLPDSKSNKHLHRRLPAPPRRKKSGNSPKVELACTTNTVGPLTGSIICTQKIYENIPRDSSIENCMRQEVIQSAAKEELLQAEENSFPINHVIENAFSHSLGALQPSQTTHTFAAENQFVSNNIISHEGGGVVDFSGLSHLDNDIDNNLRNIESSFQTLDVVLKSLQNYSRISPSRVIITKPRRLSCDVICDVNLNVSDIEKSETTQITQLLDNSSSVSESHEVTSDNSENNKLLRNLQDEIAGELISLNYSKIPELSSFPRTEDRHENAPVLISQCSSDSDVDSEVSVQCHTLKLNLGHPIETLDGQTHSEVKVISQEVREIEPEDVVLIPDFESESSNASDDTQIEVTLDTTRETKNLNLENKTKSKSEDKFDGNFAEEDLPSVDNYEQLTGDVLTSETKPKVEYLLEECGHLEFSESKQQSHAQLFDSSILLDTEEEKKSNIPDSLQPIHQFSLSEQLKNDQISIVDSTIAQLIDISNVQNIPGTDKIPQTFHPHQAQITQENPALADNKTSYSSEPVELPILIPQSAEGIETIADQSAAVEEKKKVDTSILKAGVSDITTRLEGIRTQLEAVIDYYIADNSSDTTSSNDTTPTDSSPNSASISNRSSGDFTIPESPTPSFYSLSQHTPSNFSLCSYYTAAEYPSSASLFSDSSTNTASPSVSLTPSNHADDEDLTSSAEEMGAWSYAKLYYADQYYKRF